MSRHSVAVIDQQNAEWNRLERQIGINSQLYNENRTDKSSRRGQYEAWTGSIHPKSPTLNGEANMSLLLFTLESGRIESFLNCPLKSQLIRPM
ncbi:hypothetical protein NC652_006949 [Populus alba x Populus x berolinensis]|nr:hypothetical protein NC652_006949 [Populus alba x Populus x berolinensis]